MVLEPGYEDAPDTICHNPANRRIGGQEKSFCCEECFEAMKASGEWAEGELEREYPPL